MQASGPQSGPPCGASCVPFFLAGCGPPIHPLRPGVPIQLRSEPAMRCAEEGRFCARESVQSLRGSRLKNGCWLVVPSRAPFVLSVVKAAKTSGGRSPTYRLPPKPCAGQSLCVPLAFAVSTSAYPRLHFLRDLCALRGENLEEARRAEPTLPAPAEAMRWSIPLRASVAFAVSIPAFMGCVGGYLIPRTSAME